MSTNVVVGMAQALEYERKGHTMLRSLIPSGLALKRLSAAVESEYDYRAREAYTAKLLSLGVGKKAMSQYTSPKEALFQICHERKLPMPSLQVYNLHRAERPASDTIRKLVTSPELGRVAAELLGVDSVMLYQTAAHFKGAGGRDGATAWHSDLNTAPFDTNDMVTLWIALTPVPTPQHSPLEFADRSHKDFALAFWYDDRAVRHDLDALRQYEVAAFRPLAPGDATAHAGWLLHAAPPNVSDQDRRALTVSYVVTHAPRLGIRGTRQTPNDVDRQGYDATPDDRLLGNTHEAWIPQIKPGRPVRHQELPVVYTKRR